MKPTSSYDNITGIADWKRQSITSARFQYDVAKREIENIASEMFGIEGSIIDAIKDKDDADYIANQYLKDRQAKLSEAFRRLFYFQAELKSYGEDV